MQSNSGARQRTLTSKQMASLLVNASFLLFRKKEVRFRRIGTTLFRWLSTANYNETKKQLTAKKPLLIAVRLLTFDLNNVLVFVKLVMDNIVWPEIF